MVVPTVGEIQGAVVVVGVVGVVVAVGPGTTVVAAVDKVLPTATSHLLHPPPTLLPLPQPQPLPTPVPTLRIHFHHSLKSCPNCTNKWVPMIGEKDKNHYESQSTWL